VTSINRAGNLHAKLPVAIGCRIMLSENLWVECGLVNGAFGTVCDIIWDPGVDDASKEAPRALLVHFKQFKQYTGPSFSHTADGKPVIPILRPRREFSYSNTIYSRT
jgi:hypothetical protein